MMMLNPVQQQAFRQLFEAAADGRQRRTTFGERPMTHLSRVLEEVSLELFVQPILPFAAPGSERPRCEILLCLPDEHGGVGSPDALFPGGERYSLSAEIGRWVVRQTVEQIGNWHRDHPDDELPVCSVNLNVASLDDAELVPAVRESLAQHRLPPEALCFEIPEAAALDDFGRSMRLSSEIRAVGCGVGLGGFGRGLDSFVHLKGLPFEYVKIGGPCVRGVRTDPVCAALVRAISEIGRIMGITTIAAEVENEITLHELRRLGLGYAQGVAVASALPLIDLDGDVALPRVRRAA